MVKFQFKGKKVTHNAHELILENKLSVDEVCEFVNYYSKLCRWWEFYYNSNQPVEIIIFK
jgi:hypothetical protein